VVGSPARAFPLCPNCYNSPLEVWGPMWDADSEEPHRRCLECPLPDGHPLVQALTVGDDPESGGVFILDVSSGPKWRFASTRSSCYISLNSKVVKKVTVLSRRRVRLEFHSGASPLEDGALEHVGAPMEDPVIQELLTVREGSDRLAPSMRGGRGRGRGGMGRGGRNRGRGGHRRGG